MRIQHNIMAMNSYRNLSMNNSKLSKNLEKLSSGYRINRAGDDAAGLAISEKMRAQIAGLDQAQKNAQSGINLVQTAEGALTEVHDMLNRMVTLATQAANGTYSDTDQAKIQSEIDALTEEIDRISENSNFNGTKLLDGSLAGGIAGALKDVVADVSKLGIDLVANATDTNAVAGVYKTSDLADSSGITVNADKKDRINLSVNFTDTEGNEKTVKISLFTETTSGSTKIFLDDGTEDGKELTATTTNGTMTQAELATAMAEALNANDTIKGTFTVAASTNALTFTAKEKGTDGAVLNSIELTTFDHSAKDTGPTYGVTNYATKVDVTTEAVDEMKSYDFAANAKVWDNTLTKDTTTSVAKLEDAIFEVNGDKFVFLKNAPNADDLAALEAAGVTHWVKTAGSAVVAGELTTMIEKIEKETGLDLEQGTNTSGVWAAAASGTSVVFKNGKVETEGTEGSALTLQIGSEAVETIDVAVESMKAKDLGIEGLDIGDADKANKAIETVKAAIEQVSVTRGNLGAIQNRLEHTINNLGVMEENIQDAEANIRDTDIADEMMAYTKNNILIQSAQAMLAQANQVPQGVLQLMQ